jgi:Zn-dependent protease
VRKFRKLLLGLLAKFGGKLLAVAIKLVKALKVGKVALASLSFAAYASMFTWRFALLILGSLAFHELGHIWAMHKCGMKTKGIYFIPLLGAAAVTEDAFPSREVESFVALAGPVWGLSLALATAGVYLVTQSPVYAAAAGWMAMINLFNLLPINPLDGGRVAKSVFFSIHQRAGKIFGLCGLVACIYLAVKLKMGLFVLLLVVGTFELLSDGKTRARKISALEQECRLAEANLILMQMARSSDTVGLECANAERAGKLSALDRLFRMQAGMAARAVISSILLYMSLSAALWVVMDATKHVPGSEVAMKFMQGS